MTHFTLNAAVEHLTAVIREWSDDVEQRHFSTLTTMEAGERLCFHEAETGDETFWPTKVHLEMMRPSDYTREMAEFVRLATSTSMQGGVVPPLNENAHLSCLVLDIDDGNVPEYEVANMARLIQLALSLHINITTRAVVTGRLTEKNERRYHIYFPDVVLFDIRIWTVIKSIVKSDATSLGHFKEIDGAPTAQRHIRVHGTRRNVESPAGVYQIFAAYDCSFLPAEITDLPNYLDCLSIRPSVASLIDWMLDPHRRFRTGLAVSLYGDPPAPDSALKIMSSWLFTDDQREGEPKLLMTDRTQARWALTEYKRYCSDCDDVYPCRVLNRFTTISDDKTAVYRWCLCTKCRWLTSLPFRLADNTGSCLTAYANLKSVDVSLVAAQLPLYCIPLEVCIASGLTSTMADGTDYRRLYGSLSIADLVRLLAGPGLSVLSHNYNLTAEQCGRSEHQLARLAVGLANINYSPPEPSASVCHIATVQAPCGAGKSVYAFEAIAKTIVSGGQALVVAPRKSLTNELTTRIRTYLSTNNVRRLYDDNEPSVAYYIDMKGDAREQANIHDVVVVTPESLPSIVMRGQGGSYSFGRRLLVIDEICTVVKTIYTSSTTAARRVSIINAFKATMAHSPEIIVLDKDIGFAERLFLANAVVYMHAMPRPPVLGNLQASIVPTVVTSSIVLADELQRKMVMWPNFNAATVKIAELLANDETSRVAVFMASNADTATLETYIKTALPNIKVMVMAGHIDEEVKYDFSQNPDAMLEADDTRLLIYTTTANVGISIEIHPFTDVFVFLGAHLTWRDALQAEARVRRIQNQPVWHRTINVCLGNLKSAKPAFWPMPTIGTAIVAKANQVSVASNQLKYAAITELKNVTGQYELHETTDTVLYVAVEAMLDYESDQQFHALDSWCKLHNVEMEFIEEEAVPEDAQAIKAARKEGKELRRSAGALSDADGPTTKKTKMNKAVEVVGSQPLETIVELVKSDDFRTWASTQRNKTSVDIWRAVHCLTVNNLAEFDSERLASNSIDLSKLAASHVQPALLTVAAAHCCSGFRIYDGEPMTKAEAVYPAEAETTFINPFDPRKMMTADDFFNHLKECGPLIKLKHPVTKGCSHNFTSFIRTYTEPDEAEERPKHRAEWAYRLLSALSGGGVIMSDPKKMIWTTRKRYNDPDMFASSNVDNETIPW